MASNMSSAQFAQITVGTAVSSQITTYVVQSIVGQGTFGTVAKCINMGDMRTVALKMMKNEGYLAHQSEEEVKTLRKLSVLDPDKCNFVRWHGAFIDKGHYCLAFEPLDKSLMDFMMERQYCPLLLKEIRPIFQQLANALKHLKSLRMIHADLKLENVMFVNHAQQPFRVKVIDFGLVQEMSAARLGSYIQTRQYRSPEIILGLPFSEAVDMWSLGCMAAFLYFGKSLFPGHSEYDMMRYIEDTQGHMPDYLLSRGLKTIRFYQRLGNGRWTLKPPTQYFMESGIQPLETRTMYLTSLDQILSVIKYSDNAADRAAESSDLLMFVDMLKGMLQLDAANRPTPCQVMEHPFITMSYIISMRPISWYVQSSCEIMAACQHNNQSFDSGKPAGWGPSQPGQPIATHPAWYNRNQIPSVNPCPSTCTTTTSAVKSGQKRKVDHVDEAYHPSKRVKPWQNNQTQRNFKRKEKRKIDHSEDPRNRSCDRSEPERKRARESCNYTETYHHRSRTYHRNPPKELHGTLHSTGSGVKRKAARDDFFSNSARNQTQSDPKHREERRNDHSEDPRNRSCDRSEPERKRARESCKHTETQHLHAQTERTNPPEELQSTLHSTGSGVKRKAAQDEENQSSGCCKKINLNEYRMRGADNHCAVPNKRT